MHEHNPQARRPGRSDIEAVRSALLRLGTSEELIGEEEFASDARDSEARRTARRVRRALVDELLDVLDAREDLIDLQIHNGLDPLELLIRDEAGEESL
jgi:hypothetical protein